MHLMIRYFKVDFNYFFVKTGVKYKQKAFMHYRLLLLFLVSVMQSTAQNINNEQVKRVQRSIFIFNFSEQIKWTNNNDSESFNIGVLGPDRTVIDLKALSLKRKIHGKPVNVVRFKHVKDIKNIQLLYVNKNFNFNLDYILSKIGGKPILLVTEDYNFHSSMINMVNVGHSFEYEIQTIKIENQGLKYAKSIVNNAITSSQKWKELYKTTEANLILEKQNNTINKQELSAKSENILSQNEKIERQRTTINTIENQVENQGEWIKELDYLNNWQQQKFEDKQRIESRLEAKIKEQIKAINQQEIIIANSENKISEQLQFLKIQEQKILLKNRVLTNKDEALDVYRKINVLLIIIALLVVLGGVLIYRSYLDKKKLNETLEIKNLAIAKQNKSIGIKNRELEQFVYIASHDLKEPLVTITGLIELIKEDYDHVLDNDGKKVLGFINESSNRMRLLIEGLLEYSKLGNCKKNVLLNCNTLVTAIKADLSNVIIRSKAKIISSELPELEGLELELRLLFQNLIANAIKFRKVGTAPIIHIDSKKLPDINDPGKGVYQFSIKDNGIGIDKKHYDRVFSIFQRLHAREDYAGTGIGLAHCKKIVEAHDGAIWLESEIEKGTTFYFTIPYGNIGY